MWIVQLALRRPYTFIVLAIFILIAGVLSILKTPKDIFPDINIPVCAAIWNFTGMPAEEFSNRITSVYERILTTVVNDIEHIESTSYNGIGVVKIYLQPNASVPVAMAQLTAASQAVLKQLPPGETPPLILSFSASNVPVLRLGLSGANFSEQQLNDLALNFLRVQLVTVPGAAVPYPYGGKQRVISVDINSQELQARGLSPADVITAINAQNVILPSGTVKIGEQEFDIGLNCQPKIDQRAGRHPSSHAQRHDHLCARCGERARRVYPSDKHRPFRWAAGDHGPGPKERQGVDVGYCSRARSSWSNVLGPACLRA